MRKKVLTLLVLALVASALTPIGSPRELTVTSTADSGPGTLREALLRARSGDTINFDPDVFPPSDPATIYIRSELPFIQQGSLTLDASNAGVILDGGSIRGGWVPGLEITSNGNTVQGLQVVNFAGAGIVLSEGAQHSIIGGDRGVGTGPVGQGNLISGNTSGIALGGYGTAFNTILGNLIGTDVSGERSWSGGNDWGNEGTGVYVSGGASDNTIGPGNIIAYNREEGVQVYNPDSLRNTIAQNSIHDNGIIGILLNGGGNAGQSPPHIIEYDLEAGTVSGTTCSSCMVEIFSDDENEGGVYEGRTRADSGGFFTFRKGAPFTGPRLTATATDTEGNTSQFSKPTLPLARTPILQEGNSLPKARIQLKESRELEGNRIGTLWHGFADEPPCEYKYYVRREAAELGLQQVKIAWNSIDSADIDWNKAEFTIHYCQDALITELARNDIEIRYILSFWDKDYRARGGEISIPRFQTEDEIQRYLDFVRFLVRNFKDRIQYFAIWNEPDIQGTLQWIEVEDYINLVKRAVPVIREEYPEAKIVVGATSYLISPESREYLFTILRSDIMPLVNGVSWHPMYGTSPEYDFHREYYYEYPSIVQEIKDVAFAHGFEGEFFADELTWGVPGAEGIYDPTVPWPMTYTDIAAAKYLARAILMHLGMDVAVTVGVDSVRLPVSYSTVQNLCNIMAGAQPESLPVSIQSEATNIKSYGFSLTDGDKLLALWTDGVAADDDPGMEAALVFPRLSAQKVTGIDVLHGFEQELITETEGGNLVIRDLLVKDYPIILRLTGVERAAPSRSRVLDASEYRLIYDADGTLLRLENVTEPRDATGVVVTVKATINGQEKTISDMVDIVDGKSTKDIRLGSLFDSITIQEVKIEY